MRLLVELVFDAEKAKKHFRNQYGPPTASDDEQWAVHLAAGQALGVDMVPAMRVRALLLIADLLKAAKRMTPDASEFNASNNEAEFMHSIRALGLRGSPVRDMVSRAPDGASVAEIAVLDMARFAMGDPERIAQVAQCAHEVTGRESALLRRPCSRCVQGSPDDPRALASTQRSPSARTEKLLAWWGRVPSSRRCCARAHLARGRSKGRARESCGRQVAYG